MTDKKMVQEEKIVNKSIELKRSARYPYYFINGALSTSVLNALRNELSFFVGGYEKTTSYKNGSWDGKECLLYQSKRGDFFFPCGLVKTVCGVLDAYSVKYLINDETELPPSSAGLKKISPLKLRDYQKDAVQSVVMNNGGVVALPTGAGKTMLALQLIYAYDLPALILVNTKELLAQWQNDIRDFFGIECGMVGDGVREFKTITVAMVQTMYNIVTEEETEINFPVLVVDECHRVAANTVYKVAMNCYACVRVGLSATPERTDGADKKIWAAVGEICSNITAEMLIDRGYLAKPNFIFESVPATRVSAKAKWHQAYNDLIVTNEVRNDKIVKIATNLMEKGYKAFVSVNRIDHGDLLARRIKDAVFFSGKTKSSERQEIIKRFREGDLNCIVSTLLSEGVNLPEMDAIILAGGGKSTVLTIQRVGRALRITPDKDSAIIVDFLDKGRYVSDHTANRLETYKKYYGKHCVLPSERFKKKKAIPE